MCMVKPKGKGFPSMSFKLYKSSYFEFALNLFMSEVGCSLTAPSSMSLVSFCI